MPTLQDVVPILRVTNLDASLPFYRDQFGFAVEWIHQFDSKTPRLAMVRRDAVRLFLTEHPVAPSGAAIYCDVDGVDALATEVQKAGAIPALEPTTQPWGRRETWFRDPDGNVLRFSETEHPPEPS